MATKSACSGNVSVDFIYRSEAVQRDSEYDFGRDIPRWSIDFDAPQYLILLALLPVFWLIGRRLLRALGLRLRQVAMFLRLAVATLLILTLAEPNWLTLVRRLTVLFVIDASDSIQHDELAHALEYVNAAAQQRNKERGDRVGVLVFGRGAGVEITPIDQPWKVISGAFRGIRGSWVSTT